MDAWRLPDWLWTAKKPLLPALPDRPEAAGLSCKRRA